MRRTPVDGSGSTPAAQCWCGSGSMKVVLVEFPMLSKGQNLSLPADVEQIDVVLGWTESEIEVDASALLLNADRKVRSDEDFVFYNQPESTDGSIRFLGTSGTEEGAQARIAIDLSAVPEDVHTVALVGSVGNGRFGDLGKLALRVVDGAGYTLAEYVTADATTESAFVFGEVYRRNGEWKIRAVGQGWESGLAGLATDFGVDIDNEPEPEPTTGDTSSDPAEPAAPASHSFAGDATKLVPELPTPPTAPATQTKARTRGVRTAK